MQKKTLYILILIILTVVFGSWSVTFASKTLPNENCTYTGNDLNKPTNLPCVPAYKLLAPLPGLDNSTPFYPADEGSLGTYVNLIIKLVIGISAVLAVLMIVMGGIEYMGSELISSKEAGKDKIQNALFGLLIALGAWALLNTINGELLNSDINIDTVTITVEIGDNVPQTPVNGRYSDGSVAGAPIVGIRTPLPSFARIYNNQCYIVGQANCTSTAGFIATPLNAIHAGCNCDLLITGATESWLHGGNGHGTTHGQGSGTVDLDTTPALDRYFTGSTATPEKKWYQTPAGYALYEGNHWHFNPNGKH